jgi:hypothetical protein
MRKMTDAYLLCVLYDILFELLLLFALQKDEATRLKLPAAFSKNCCTKKLFCLYFVFVAVKFFVFAFV